MSQQRLTWLADELRAAGLKVVEIPGWQTRSRPASTGGFNPVGTLQHHTGSRDADVHSLLDDRQYAGWLALTGRSDLPPPLCQTSTGRDGTVYVCAAGRANHAGVAKAVGSVAAGDGNDLYAGDEAQNSGSEGWTKAQYDAMVTGRAVILNRLGSSSRACAGHKETSVTGKWDPGLIDMDDFRRDVAAKQTELKVAAGKAPAKPAPTNVAAGRALIRQGLRALRKAPATRLQVAVMRREIRAALKAGPKS